MKIKIIYKSKYWRILKFKIKIKYKYSRIIFANKKIKTAERLSMSAFWLAILGVVFFGFAFSIVLHKLFA